MIYLHMDKRYGTDQWYRRFEYLLDQKGAVRKNVNLLRSDFRRFSIEPQDGLIGRFGHSRRDLRRMRPIFQELSKAFSERIFPSEVTYRYYDDKRSQIELFTEQAFPMPRGAYVETPSDVVAFLEGTGLRFPLVSKRLFGASSSQVRMATGLDDVLLPGVVQEFCRNNDGDLRIVVIGNRVMGFFRRNRPNDFRASGSGLIEYVEDLDPECVRIAFEISSRMGFDSMAYDFVRDNQGRWVVLECSYVYLDTAVRDCRYYYEMPSGQRCDKSGVYPEDFILEDFLAKYPDAVEGQNGRSLWIRTADWLTGRAPRNSKKSESGGTGKSRAA
jgi:hypothetical protein